jgi:cell division transport system permease protein
MQLILGEALTGLRRNASMVISVVLVTFVSLTFVGAAMLMQMQIGKMRDYWSERAQVSVSCAARIRRPRRVPTAPRRRSRSIRSRSACRARAERVVRDVRFESSDEAYQNLLKLYGDEYKDYVTPAQLGDTYFVGLIDPEKADVITEAFNGMAGVEEVKNQLQYLEPLFSALTIATYIAVGIAVLMLIAAVLLIATTIRLSAYARRRRSASCDSSAPRTGSSRRRSSWRASSPRSSARSWRAPRSSWVCTSVSGSTSRDG